jgi:hypothetical protein
MKLINHRLDFVWGRFATEGPVLLVRTVTKLCGTDRLGWLAYLSDQHSSHPKLDNLVLVKRQYILSLDVGLSKRGSKMNYPSLVWFSFKSIV